MVASTVVLCDGKCPAVPRWWKWIALECKADLSNAGNWITGEYQSQSHTRERIRVVWIQLQSLFQVRHCFDVLSSP